MRSKPAEAAEAIKSFSDLPSSLSLPVNLTAILKKEGRQEHGVLETLEQVADLLAAARRAFSTCLSTPMSGDNLCKSDTEFPFHFLRDDPSNEMAFANMVAKYKARWVFRLLKLLYSTIYYHKDDKLYHSGPHQLEKIRSTPRLLQRSTRRRKSLSLDLSPSRTQTSRTLILLRLLRPNLTAAQAPSVASSAW